MDNINNISKVFRAADIYTIQMAKDEVINSHMFDSDYEFSDYSYSKLVYIDSPGQAQFKLSSLNMKSYTEQVIIRVTATGTFGDKAVAAFKYNVSFTAVADGSWVPDNKFTSINPKPPFSSYPNR